MAKKFTGTINVTFEADDEDDAVDQLEWLVHFCERDGGAESAESAGEVEEVEEDE